MTSISLIPKMWGDDETQIEKTYEVNDRLMIHSFLENYDSIYQYNKPIFECFHKIYYEHFIVPLLFFQKINFDNIGFYNKYQKSWKYFRIYPFYKYFLLFPFGDKFRDCSIIFKVIEQLTTIFQYNITSEINNPFMDQTFVKDMELIVIEMARFNEFFCFIVPKKSKKNEKNIEENENNMGISSFQQFKDRLWEVCEKTNDISRFQTFLKMAVPGELVSLVQALEKNSGKKYGNQDFLECFFMEKCYSVRNIILKVDCNFLQEFYLLLQISKICNEISKDLNENVVNFEEEFKNIKKRTREAAVDLNKDESKTVENYFHINNKNSFFLISMIKKPDFMEKLILFSDEWIFDLMKPNNIKKLTPLNIFTFFMMKIQVLLNMFHLFLLLLYFLKSQRLILQF